jgi:hypothetical protein
MIRRRHTDSYGADADRALRSALTMAAESVEPADNGLDLIRSKIAADQAAHQVRWRFGVQGPGEPWWRSLLPPRGWFPAIGAAVAERFRPDPNRAGWFGWLRPAAAVGTGLFVATAASWAVAALPAVISPSSSTGGNVIPPGHTKTHHPTKPGTPGYPTPGNGSVGPSGQNGGQPGGAPPPPGTAPSCSPSGTPSATPTGTPSTGGTPSETPPPTDGGTPTPTDGGSTAPAPGDSGTSSPTAGSAPTTGSTTDNGSQPTPGSAPTPGNQAIAPVSATSPDATGKALISRSKSRAGGWQPQVEVAAATLVDATTVSPSPVPLDTPLPTASPTLGGPIPTQTPTPTVPPTPCP